MSWGYKILLFYLLFVAGILIMVFKSFNQKVELVTTDYYAKELVYQQQIDKVSRSNALTENVKIIVAKSELQVVFPKEFTGKKIEGQVHLYFAADSDKDIILDFSVTESNIIMKVPEKNKGMHQLKLNWSVNKTSYYFEKKIFL